jgi:hypothetical protein
MGGRASVFVEIVMCFGGVVRQGICESRFFLKPGGCVMEIAMQNEDPGMYHRQIVNMQPLRAFKKQNE